MLRGYSIIVGLYRVLKKIGNLYKVKLLDLIKVYSIFLLEDRKSVV